MNDLRIARLTPRDAKGLSDHLLNLRSVVSQREDIYPGIDRWFDKKVISGLATKSRIAYVGLVDEVPAIAAIVKLGENTKVCHINIRDDLQDNGLGEMFFSLLALEARNQAKSLHLTLPESLWTSKMGFFRDFGLNKPTAASKQYRMFDSELSLQQDFSTIWNSVLEKIPKLAQRFSLAGNLLSSGVLFSIQPLFGEKIMLGTKTIEIRRRFSRSWLGQRAVFYASSPVRALIGQARIKAIYEGKPKEIWSKFNNQIGCDESYFAKYVAGCKSTYAIELDEVNPFIEPIYTTGISQYTKTSIRAPQSYLSLANDQQWSEAVNISVMLQCLFKRVGVTLDETHSATARTIIRERRAPRIREEQEAKSLTQTNLFENKQK